MDKTKIINLMPGTTFFAKMTGKTKVRLFFVLTIVIMMSFDLPILLPVFIYSVVSLISLKPNWKTLGSIFLFVLVMNMFNIFLYWIANPQVGLEYTNDATVLVKFTDYLVITRGSLWFLSIRLFKMLTMFFASFSFIISITPSEMAAGFYSLGLGYKFASIVEIAFRYIPDISRDYQNISVSMQCRGLEMDAKKEKPYARMKKMINILIPLVITSFDRVGNIANAMDLRGFGKNKKRTYFAEHEPTVGDKIFTVVYILLALFVVYFFVKKYVCPPATAMWIYW